MADSQKGIDPIAYLVYGNNQQLRASATSRLQAIREDRAAAVATAQNAYRNTEKLLLDAVLSWKQADDTERSQRALEVGKLQQALAKLDTERKNIEYPQRFLQQVLTPPVFLSKQVRIPVRERTIPL